MTAEKQSALQTIEEKKSLITGIADKIWGFAELSLQEFKSAETYCEALEKEGFEVAWNQQYRDGFCGILWPRTSVYRNPRRV